MADVSPEQWTQIEAELAKGRKINAIKLYRKFAEVDLYNARKIVDEHHARLQELDPLTYPKPKPGGCGTKVGVFLMMLAAFGIALNCLV